NISDKNDQIENGNATVLPDTISVLMSVSRNSHESLSNVIAAEIPDYHQVKKALEGKIHTGSILITPGDEVFSFLNESDKLIYRPVLSRKRQKKHDPVNLDTSQSHTQAFTEFLIPFHGVAT